MPSAHAAAPKKRHITRTLSDEEIERFADRIVAALTRPGAAESSAESFCRRIDEFIERIDELLKTTNREKAV